LIGTFKYIYFVNFVTNFLYLIINCQIFILLLKNKIIFSLNTDNISVILYQYFVLSHPYSFFKITTQHVLSRLWVASLPKGFGERKHKQGRLKLKFGYFFPRLFRIFQYLGTGKTRIIPDQNPITSNSNTAIT